MVDLLTVIPTWATLGQPTPLYPQIDGVKLGTLYILNLLKATRVLRPLRVRRKFQHIEDEVQRALADMILRIVVMILFSELAAMWFTVVTVFSCAFACVAVRVL